MKLADAQTSSGFGFNQGKRAEVRMGGSERTMGMDGRALKSGTLGFSQTLSSNQHCIHGACVWCGHCIH